MDIPDKAEAMALFIRDMKYYGNKLYRFVFYEYYLLKE
tara:strand:+ start:958 stop:1071 length:114 start_codon:yes stop_codon:yes gene_type:complete